MVGGGGGGGVGGRRAGREGEVTRRRRGIEEERGVSGDECGEAKKRRSRETDETEGWMRGKNSSVREVQDRRTEGAREGMKKSEEGGR